MISPPVIRDHRKADLSSAFLMFPLYATSQISTFLYILEAWRHSFESCEEEDKTDLYILYVDDYN